MGTDSANQIERNFVIRTKKDTYVFMKDFPGDDPAGKRHHSICDIYFNPSYSDENQRTPCNIMAVDFDQGPYQMTFHGGHDEANEWFNLLKIFI